MPVLIFPEWSGMKCLSRAMLLDCTIHSQAIHIIGLETQDYNISLQFQNRLNVKSDGKKNDFYQTAIKGLSSI